MFLFWTVYYNEFALMHKVGQFEFAIHTLICVQCTVDDLIEKRSDRAKKSHGNTLAKEN